MEQEIFSQNREGEEQEEKEDGIYGALFLLNGIVGMNEFHERKDFKHQHVEIRDGRDQEYDSGGDGTSGKIGFGKGGGDCRYDEYQRDQQQIYGIKDILRKASVGKEEKDLVKKRGDGKIFPQCGYFHIFQHLLI